MSNRHPLVVVSNRKADQKRSKKDNKKDKDKKGNSQEDAPKKGPHRSHCAICCKISELFGIGSCLHPCCMECSIRIRIIGQSKTCFQCRMEIETLYFVPSARSSSHAYALPESTIDDEAASHGIKYASEYALECYKSYLSCICGRCPRGNRDSFATFAALHQHMANSHKLSFCHLCTENMNMLPKDRRVYTRLDLQKHLEGTLHEIGFRGHPKCMFCERRFYDEEDRYKHLRRDHYYCAFCDYDGMESANVFYRNRFGLRRHYGRMHYLCRERECEELLVVFRSRDELAVHRERVHQAHRRPLQLEFRIGRSNNSNRVVQEAAPQTSIGDSTVSANNVIIPSAQLSRPRMRIVESAFRPQEAINFPVLPSIPVLVVPHSSLQIDQFPSLSTAPAASTTSNKRSVWTKGNVGELFKNKPNNAKPPKAFSNVAKKPKSNVDTADPPNTLPVESEAWKQKRTAFFSELAEKTEIKANVARAEKVKSNRMKKSKSTQVKSKTNEDEKGIALSNASSKFAVLASFDEPSEMGVGTNKNLWKKDKKSSTPNNKKPDSGRISE